MSRIFSIMPNNIDKTDFKYVYFLISNKINKNTMYIQINNFNKSDIGKQQFQKTRRKSCFPGNKFKPL